MSSSDKSLAIWTRQTKAPPLTASEVHVWRLVLKTAEQGLTTVFSLLAPDEKDRARRFVTEQDRNRYMIARGMLRKILGSYLGRAAGSLRFRYSNRGKPFLEEGPNGESLCFNVTHCADLALIAVSRHRPVGVDLERVRSVPGFEKLAARFFSANEVNALRAIPAERRHEAFILAWTRKEAFLKATGEGVAGRTRDFDVSLDPFQPALLLATRPDPGEAGRWKLVSLAPAPGLASAVAARGTDWCTALWEADF